MRAYLMLHARRRNWVLHSLIYNYFQQLQICLDEVSTSIVSQVFHANALQVKEEKD